MRSFSPFGLLLALIAPLLSACASDLCTPQGACPNLGAGVTYELCCPVGGDCTYRFPDGHEIGPFDPSDVDANAEAIDEALAYCTGEGAGDGGVTDTDGGAG